MEFAYTLGGGTPLIKKYLVDGGATVNAGVPVLSDGATADTEGVRETPTTPAAEPLGLAVDTASSTDAQVATGNNGGFVSVIINPDGVYRAKMSGGAAADTALTALTQSGASAAGTTITSATDKFTVWGYTGGNVGHYRFMTAAATCVLAFPNAIADGDTFLEANLHFASPQAQPTLCTELTQIDVSTAVATADTFYVVDMELRDSGLEGNVNSYAHLVCADHIFAGQIT